jgi:hypothetical protein
VSDDAIDLANRLGAGARGITLEAQRGLSSYGDLKVGAPWRPGLPAKTQRLSARPRASADPDLMMVSTDVSEVGFQ